MKILIEISNKRQAHNFIDWIKYRGDITLGDEIEIRHYASNADWQGSYVYIVSATEMEK